MGITGAAQCHHGIVVHTTPSISKPPYTPTPYPDTLVTDTIPISTHYNLSNVHTLPPIPNPSHPH